MTPRLAQLYETLELGPIWTLRAQNAPGARIDSQDPAHESGAVKRLDTSIGQLDWEALAEQVAGCQRCRLCETRKQTVFGVGPRSARVMIVGEAPGQEEDLRGEPFVGQAGRLLDNMLAAVDLTRAQQVYIANVLKCRPPGNRNPEPAEVQACEPYLKRQLELLAPDLIIVMGRFAAQTLVGSDASIASLRGKRHDYALGNRTIPMIVTYHPAYLLRNLPDKAKAWSDLLLARRLLADQSAPT